MSTKNREYLTTREVALYLRLNEKKVYALVAAGQLPAARISGKWLFPRHLVDQWVEHNTVYPTSGMLGGIVDRMLVLQGSDDYLLSSSVERIHGQKHDSQSVVSSKVGSVAGLEALGSGAAHLASCHVEEELVRSIVCEQGQGCYVLNLFRRRQGLIFDRQRNPDITGLEVVAARKLRFADRQAKSGTYRLVEHHLRQRHLEASDLNGVGPFSSHLDLALAIRSGRADAGVGIQVVADLCGLDFIPIGDEPFMLVVSSSYAAHPRIMRFFELIQDDLDRAAKRHVSGYDFSTSGKTTILSHA